MFKFLKNIIDKIRHKREYKYNDLISLLFLSILGRPADLNAKKAFSKKLLAGMDPIELVKFLEETPEYSQSYKLPKKDKLTGTSNQPYVWDTKSYRNLIPIDKNSIKKIIVFKLDHIGDFILALDSFIKLRREFDRSEITCVCGSWNADFAAKCGLFDNIIICNFSAARADTKAQKDTEDTFTGLFCEPYDLAIDLRVSPETRIMFNYVQSQIYCGYESGCTSRNLDVCLSKPVLSQGLNKDYYNKFHMLHIIDAICEAFSKNRVKDLLNQVIMPKDSDAESNKINRKVIVQPFSGAVIKNWPLDNYAKLISWIINNYDNVTIQILGKKDDLGLLSDDFETILTNARVVSFIDKTNIIQAFELIADCDIYIGNDTGLTHFSAEYGKATLCFFSGVDAANLYAPYGNNTRLLKFNVGCSPCFYTRLEQCEYNQKCLTNINIEFAKMQFSEMMNNIKMSS